MSDGISFFNNDDVDKYVDKVMSQTNYTEEEARAKLELFNGDYMRVLRDYLGIPEKQELKPKSMNQEIYRQIRTRLDSSMKEYREKNPIDMEQVVTNLKESEEREKKKIKQMRKVENASLNKRKLILTDTKTLQSITVQNAFIRSEFSA